ncbi:hypothetical protein Pmar_PMAR013363 [Perkinsus marinus ATCC 50983]|uniref:CCHC-type domain-containing protein n=1 Tax=Perkinsus marinus (strain ATCC 50983 / TXsc) TaxID=423536 RepID=C5LF25_PERM5|nr:hypothetical protein Pmar_PMAR013363 [Perkinsus marinus ATCC 50983]EER04663.1 hypothetical protein Pmar_PMAR013363 [Perkinsus marinus ATCC 50983]|eukprot:XP_002772847.1 hypothetical protein Pmar_PMAR013363 [Perkinsus marinus ATCC 50983]
MLKRQISREARKVVHPVVVVNHEGLVPELHREIGNLLVSYGRGQTEKLSSFAQTFENAQEEARCLGSKTCRYCREHGHLIADCPKLAKPYQLRKSKDEVSEAALFDTGATFNYISSALLLSFNEVGHFYQLEKANHHSVSLADGSKVESDGSVKILVRYGGSQRMLLFHVVPSLSPRVVIGWEGIAALGLLIDAYRSDIVCSVEESDDSLQSPLLARMGLTDDDIIPKDQLINIQNMRQ